MFVELIKEYDDSSKEELEEDDDVVEEEELGVEYFDKFPTRSELTYHNNYRVLCEDKLKGRYGLSVPALHKKPQKNKDLYSVSRRLPYAISNPEASQSNLVVISHLLPLKFSNLSTRLSSFNFQNVKNLYDHRPFLRPSILSSMCSMRSRESSDRAEVEEDDRSRPRKLETSYEEVEGVCGGSATKGLFGVQVAYKEVMEVLIRCLGRPKAVNTARPNSVVVNAVRINQGHPQKKDQGYMLKSDAQDYMTGNMSYLSDFKEFERGYVTFKGGAKGGRITGKGILKTMCDKKNNVLFTDTGCFILSPDFKLADESQVLLKVPRKNKCTGITPALSFTLSFMKPFGCHVTILNTLDHLDKFDGKSDDGFFVGYSLNSKAFRVYNIRTRKVEENLHVRFLEDKPIIAGDRPEWLFDIDVLTKSINYVPVVARTNSNDFVDTKESIGAGHSSEETRSSQDYILMPIWKDGSPFDSSSKDTSNDEPQPSNDDGKKDDEGGIDDQERTENSAQDVNIVGPSINIASTNFNTGSLNINIVSPTVSTAPLESTYADFFGDESELDLSNIATTYPVPTTPNTRIHKDHSLDHMLGDVQSGVQTRRMINEQGFISAVYEGKTHKPDMFSLKDNATATHADFFGDETEVDMSNITTTYPVPSTLNTRIHKDHSLDHVIGDVHSGVLTRRMTKTTNEQGFISVVYEGKTHKDLHTYLNKKDERGIVIRNKARLVEQGYTQEEGMDYDEVFAPVARIEAIRLFLAYASFKDFVVYQMDVKSAFLYAKIEEEVYQQQVTYGDFKALLKDAEAKDVNDSPFDLEAYSDSDYAGASLDRKSTTGGCQFLGSRLISWKCKKQTIFTNSTTKAEYVVAASCRGQVLWIQNKILDYGYNFMNTKIFNDNERTICIVKNPVFHSKTKHVDIRHHFIRDFNEKKLIQMIKIHTDQNVTDLLIKAFDVRRFQYLIASIGMLNL
ncbi:putative ribonuclease H-like domain-containing protein [Tanacetum coccineum]